MKKKLLSLLLATAMIMGLAACGTAGNTDNSVSGNAEAAQTQSVPPDQRTAAAHSSPELNLVAAWDCCL